MIKSSAPVATAIAVVAFSTLTSACGADEQSDPATSASSGSTGTTMTPIDPSDLPRGPRLQHPQNAVSDIFVTNCGNGIGPVKATGFVRNSSRSRADYVIHVSWVTSKGAMVAHSLATAKHVAPGAKATWAAATTLTDDNKYACSTSIERGTLAP